MSVSVAAASYAPPVSSTTPASAPTPPSPAVNPPHDGDDAGSAAPVSAVSMSSAATQAALSNLTIGG